MYGFVEVLIQLCGCVGEWQVLNVWFVVVSGYGMVEYCYGMCVNVVVLEVVEWGV